MVGPLALCLKHQEPILDRAAAECPLCKAQKRIAELEEENEILKKAATYFAKTSE